MSGAQPARRAMRCLRHDRRVRLPEPWRCRAAGQAAAGRSLLLDHEKARMERALAMQLSRPLDGFELAYVRYRFSADPATWQRQCGSARWGPERVRRFRRSSRSFGNGKLPPAGRSLPERMRNRARLARATRGLATDG